MLDPALHARLSALIKATAKRYPYGSDIDEGCDAIADALLASEDWVAREAVIKRARTLFEFMGSDASPLAVWSDFHNALARLAAIRGTT